MSDKSTTFYWSRIPGNWVNRQTAQPLKDVIEPGLLPKFEGTVREWYETLIETVIDVRNSLHRQAFAQMGNCDPSEVNVFVSNNIQLILECSVLYKLNYEQRHPMADQLLEAECKELVGTIDVMNVYLDPLTARNAARVVATFKSPDGRSETLDGVIWILDAL